MKISPGISLLVLFLILSLPVLAEKPVKIELEIRPGMNPRNTAFEKNVAVSVNDRDVGGNIVLKHDSAPVTREFIFDQGLKAGERVKVDAVFTDLRGAHPVSCPRTWQVIRKDDLGCGPVRISFHVNSDTCTIDCQ